MGSSAANPTGSSAPCRKGTGPVIHPPMRWMIAPIRSSWYDQTFCREGRVKMREGFWVVSGADVVRALHRVGNPLVTAVLGSRFHRLLSGTHGVLTITGRRTGRDYLLPVQYALDGNTIYVVPGGFAHKTWWRNLIEPARVHLRLQGRDVTGIGQAFFGKQDPQIVEAGLRVYFTKLATSARVRGIELEGHGRPNSQQLQRAVANEVIIRVVLDAPHEDGG
jgi:hypothetical protein